MEEALEIVKNKKAKYFKEERRFYMNITEKEGVVQKNFSIMKHSFNESLDKDFLMRVTLGRNYKLENELIFKKVENDVSLEFYNCELMNNYKIKATESQIKNSNFWISFPTQFFFNFPFFKKFTLGFLNPNLVSKFFGFTFFNFF